MCGKIAVFILYGLICSTFATRMKYERGFPETIYRYESNMMPGTIYKKEPVYRETILQSEPIMPQQIMRGGAIYGGGETISVKPVVFAQEQYMQPIGNEQIMPSEPYVRTEPVIRGETYIRTEPVIRRESMIRAQPAIRGEPMYQSNVRETSFYANEPSPYTVMVTSCPCSACSGCSSCSSYSACSSCSACSQPHNHASQQTQDNYYPVQRQSLIAEPPVVSQQPIVTQHFMPQRVACQKPAAMVKPAVIHSFVTMPRMQRYVRKSYRPVTDKVQITAVPIQPPSEMTGYQVPASEPIQYSNNMSSYQNQDSTQDHTPEPQTTTVTTRSASNRFPIPPVSSIC